MVSSQAWPLLISVCSAGSRSKDCLGRHQEWSRVSSRASPIPHTGELRNHVHASEIRDQTTIRGDVSGAALIYCAVGAGPTQFIILFFAFEVRAVCLAILFLAVSSHSVPHNVCALPSGIKQCNQHLASDVQLLSPDLPRGRTVCLMCSIFMACFTFEC